ncbi:hypothetical protein RAMLITH_13380 [Ramlibacter sp. RBP-2]|uniref:Lipoprotein n=1 Tax=Ramlibacter lithotrophicus TaxID=2606681 RepID=A0A7X6I713_9BURK|nr:hypothetical protein [Ramlibacter lithotrophicus]NKE66820.1 hypothetical protein [Ramlibacter lithotrophicus]
MRNCSRATIGGAACAALCAAMLGGCAAPEPRADAWVAPAVGTTWEIAQRNSGSYGKDVRYRVTRRETTWKGAPAIALTNSLGGSIVAEPAGGKWLAMLGRDGKPAITFDPPLGWNYPLTVGKGWSDRQRLTVHATGKTLEYELSCSIPAYEKVTVPAGTFDAFRVHCTSSIGNDETFWTSPALGTFVKTRLVRAPGNPFGAGIQESELVARPQ